MDSSFLQQTARSILDKIEWKQLSRTTLVLPSHRAGLVLTNELLRLQHERHAQAVWAPTVQTLPQLQETLSPLYAEEELFSIVRLYKLYRRLAVNGERLADLMPLDMFYGWGRQMLADFTNVDVSMPAEEVPNFFANTIAAHELETWQLDHETEERLRGLINGGQSVPGTRDSVKAQYETLWQQLYELYKALHAELEAEHKGYPGMVQRAVIAHWDDDSIQQQIAGRTYIFVGFNYLLPVERELMLRLRDAGKALFYWDYVPDFRTNEKAFYFARQNHEILGGENLQSIHSDQRYPVTLVSCVSREAQAQYVHRWLQENYTAKGQKVGVVICDETMLEPVIYTLPALRVDGKEPAPVNITKGFPLRNTAVYARVLSWLGDKQRGAADEIVQPEIIDELLKRVFAEESENSEYSENSESLSWQELLILESEYQMRKIANQMRLLLTEGLGDVPFTLKLLRLLMRRMMENVSMPFHGEPVTDIQVMGVLETRLLDFDRLLLLNVEEGVIPQRQADSSFIPYYLRKAYHMQTSDERATVYAYNFFRLLSRAGNSTVLYASAETAEGGKGKSRFVMQMLYSPDFAITQTALEEPSALHPSDDRIALNGRSLLSTLKMENGQLKREDDTRFRLSPSALNTYISCPRSFYLQYILGLKPKEEEDVLFAPNTLGSFVHHCMEFIYRTYMHCDGSHPVRVSPDQIEAIRTDEEKLQTALDYAYERMNEKAETPYIPAHHRSENVIIKGYVKNILERDREDAKVGLQIYLLEKSRTFPVSIDGVGELLIGGIIDRMDLYGQEGQETLRIVDYKSGGYSDTTHAKKMSASWEELMESEDKNYLRQTLVYSQAVLHNGERKRPIEPHLFFCRHKLTDIVTTVDLNGETVHDYRTVQDTFTTALRTKIEHIIRTTEFPPCEQDKCPSYCPFFNLCGRKPAQTY